MKKENNLMYTLTEHKQKMLSNLQDFLDYKRMNSINFATRLLQDFKVVNFRSQPSDESFFVEFEGYEKFPQTNHYWVSKSEFEEFMSGKKQIGVEINIDGLYVEDGYTIIEINLIKNGFKKPTIIDANKLKGIKVKYKNNIYKSYEVQVVVSDGIYIDKIVRLFVFEQSSAESYINKHTVYQNKIEIKNGITFEDFDKQENFVRTLDAMEAVKMERDSVISEIRSWFLLNVSSEVSEQFSNSFLKKLNEIK